MGNLTKNFSEKEFLVSKSYPDLAEKIPVNRIDKLKFFYISASLLQPVRDKFGAAIRTLSGKRSKILNLVVGGVSSSDHRYRDLSAAIDWEFLSGDKGLLWKAYFFLKQSCPYGFGQMIIYLDQAGIPRFIHISLPTKKHVGQLLVKNPKGYRPYDPKVDPKE